MYTEISSMTFQPEVINGHCSTLSKVHTFVTFIAVYFFKVPIEVIEQN